MLHLQISWEAELSFSEDGFFIFGESMLKQYDNGTVESFLIRKENDDSDLLYQKDKKYFAFDLPIWSMRKIRENRAIKGFEESELVEKFKDRFNVYDEILYKELSKIWKSMIFKGQNFKAKKAKMFLAMYFQLDTVLKYEYTAWEIEYEKRNNSEKILFVKELSWIIENKVKTFYKIAKLLMPYSLLLENDYEFRCERDEAINQLRNAYEKQRVTPIQDESNNSLQDPRSAEIVKKYNAGIRKGIRKIAVLAIEANTSRPTIYKMIKEGALIHPKDINL